ncbi:MAG: hypothetical protein WC869_14265 [Phycisphaerae bacterium]
MLLLDDDAVLVAVQHLEDPGRTLELVPHHFAGLVRVVALEELGPGRPLPLALAAAQAAAGLRRGVVGARGLGHGDAVGGHGDGPAGGVGLPAEALRWLRAHATEYNFDSTKIGVLGGSEGGHLMQRPAGVRLDLREGLVAHEGDALAGIAGME